MVVRCASVPPFPLRGKWRQQINRKSCQRRESYLRSSPDIATGRSKTKRYPRHSDSGLRALSWFSSSRHVNAKCKMICHEGGQHMDGLESHRLGTGPATIAVDFQVQQWQSLGVVRGQRAQEQLGLSPGLRSMDGLFRCAKRRKHNCSAQTRNLGRQRRPAPVLGFTIRNPSAIHLSCYERPGHSWH